MVKLLTLFLLAFAIFTAPALAATDTNNKLFSVCAQNPSSSICKDKASQNASPSVNPVNHLIKVAADIVAVATGAVAVVVIIIGGITMITSAGNTEAVASSRKRIIAALVGLVIVAMAWTIISFVTDRLIK